MHRVQSKGFVEITPWPLTAPDPLLTMTRAFNQVKLVQVIIKFRCIMHYVTNFERFWVEYRLSKCVTTHEWQMPIRHYFCCMAIHRFLRACHHRLCHYQSHDRYVNPSFIPTASDSFRFSLLPWPPLSRESRPGIAVAVTPSHTQTGGQSDRPACVRAGVLRFQRFRPSRRPLENGFCPDYVRLRNSAISASPPVEGGRQRWRQWRHRNRYETETLRHISYYV